MSTSTASVVVHVWPLRARFTEIFIRVKVAQLQLSRQTYLRRGSTVRHTTGPLKAPFLLNYSAACSVKLGEELVLNLKWDSAAQPRHSIQTPHRLLLVLHSVQVHSEARRTASRDRRLAYPSHDQRRPLPVPMLNLPVSSYPLDLWRMIYGTTALLCVCPSQRPSRTFPSMVL